jgi:hypothetical protein
MHNILIYAKIQLKYKGESLKEKGESNESGRWGKKDPRLGLAGIFILFRAYNCVYYLISISLRR